MSTDQDLESGWTVVLEYDLKQMERRPVLDALLSELEPYSVILTLSPKRLGITLSLDWIEREAPLAALQNALMLVGDACDSLSDALLVRAEIMPFAEHDDRPRRAT